MPILYSQNLGGSGSALPDQTGNSGKFLTTNGTLASWAVAGGGSGITDYVSSWTNSGQSIPNATDTIINYDTALIAVGTNITITTGASWKATVNATGDYLLYAACYLGNIAVSGYKYLQVFKKGVLLQQLTNSFEDVRYPNPRGAALIHLLATDYIDIRIQQNSGGSVPLDSFSTIENYFFMVKIG